MAKKKERKPKVSVKPHTLYVIKGDSIERKRKTCPKCGKGIFLAQHKDRLVCGKCGYMEKISAKKPEAHKKEEAEAKPEVKKEHKKE